MSIRVVHLVISDLFGAGRAATRISQVVSVCGCESEVYILNKELDTGSRKIELTTKERIGRIVTKKQNEALMRKYEPDGYFHTDKYGISYRGKNFLQEADIVHVHWVNEGIYSGHFLSDAGKPVVWTLHDMWPFTGGCHYSEGCMSYTGKCGQCRCLCSEKEEDLSTATQQNRIREYKDAEIVFAGCSKWITDAANSSLILKESGKTCVNIPNPISDQWFRVRDRMECRRVLGMDIGKKAVLIGSVNLNDRRKGFDLLYEALKSLDPSEYVLCTFGNNKNMDFPGFETISFGSVFDDLHLSFIYNACDVFVAPSREENLANTVMESLACGTPVTAFDIGGMKDMIRPGENGYLAEHFDTADLAAKIRSALSGELNSREEISRDAHERFSYRTVGERYVNLYRSLLEK